MDVHTPWIYTVICKFSDNPGVERTFPSFVPTKKVTSKLPEYWTFNPDPSVISKPPQELYFKTSQSIDLEKNTILTKISMSEALKQSLEGENKWLSAASIMTIQPGQKVTDATWSVWHSHHNTSISKPPPPSVLCCPYTLSQRIPFKCKNTP